MADDYGARVELRCAACGYGASVRNEPEACPMWRGTVWEHVPPVSTHAAREAEQCPLTS